MKAVFPLLGQPPHLGNIIEICVESRRFDEIVVAVADKTIVISPFYAKSLLDIIFAHNGRIRVVVSKIDWEGISMLPAEFVDCDAVLTSSDALYTQMMTNGLEKAVLIPKSLGFCDAYMMKAFQQGIALDTLRGSMTVVNTGKLYNEKEKKEVK